MTIQELIALLQQQAGTTAPGGVASRSAKPTSTTAGGLLSGPVGTGLSIGGGSALGGEVAGLTDPLFGLNSSSAGGEGGAIGGGIGGAVGSIFGPLGTFGGAAIGDFLGTTIGDWVGGGVPRDAKSGALGSALSSSSNPIDALIGQFVDRGVGEGHVLSESGGSTFGNSVGRLAEMLQALSGQAGSPVTASGNFQNNPTYTPPAFGKSLQNFQLPAGDQFISDPSKLADAAKIIEQMTGMQASGISGKSGEAEWQKVLNDLQAQGLLQKYQGTLGAPGGGNTSAGAIPNVALPHPLTQNRAQFATAPYPV